MSKKLGVVLTCSALAVSFQACSSDDDGSFTATAGEADDSGASGGEGGSQNSGGSGSSGKTGQTGGSATAGARPSDGDGGVAGMPAEPGAGQAGHGGAGAGESGGGAGGEGGDITPPRVRTKLGSRCTSTSQCADNNAPGLICLEPDDTTLGAAPPGGLCTSQCDDHDDCLPFGNDASCVVLLNDENETGFCIEGCTFGPVPPGDLKCHGRDDFACNPTDFIPTNAPCQNDDDCEFGEFCGGDNFCIYVWTSCSPACQGDNDCAPNLYCNRDLLNGTCVPEPQTGLPLGAPCLDDAECLGFCDNTGHCSQNCSLDLPCAFDDGAQRYRGHCAYVLSIAPDATVGDFGYCAPACDCSMPCQDPETSCDVFNEELDLAVYTGAGICGDGSRPQLDCSGGAGGGQHGGAGNNAGGSSG